MDAGIPDMRLTMAIEVGITEAIVTKNNARSPTTPPNLVSVTLVILSHPIRFSRYE